MEKIQTDVLEKVFALIIDKLRFEGFQELELSQDLYRKIPTDKWSITETDKNAFVIGSLIDDWESILKLTKDPDRPCTYVDFDRVASLLRFISEKNNPVNWKGAQ